MKVKLIAHTPEPEKIVATAAKLCYSSSDVDSLMDGLTEDKIESFVDMLASIGHESPMEHVSFTFAIEGISRACSHQLVRHRIASYSQKSQRYVNENGFDFITPPAIEQCEEAKAEFDKQMAQIVESYDKISEALTEMHYKAFLAEGNDEKSARSKARKKANEDARFVLPNACETKIVVTMNVRTLFNFFKHRCCNRAQWEIKAVADEMLKICCEKAPNLFKKAGPSCVMTGRCPEGKMSCGKMPEVIAQYKQMKAEYTGGKA